MKVALIADTHDNLDNVDRVLKGLAEHGADALIHCGDICSPFIVRKVCEGFAGDIHFVLGNNDGDLRLLERFGAEYDHFTLHGVYAELEFDGVSFGVIHYPAPARRIAQSGRLDVVCYGHDHTAHDEMVGECLLVNPGELLGLQEACAWGIYDTREKSFSRFTL